MADIESNHVPAAPTTLIPPTTRQINLRRWIVAGMMLLSYVGLQVSSSQLTNYVFVSQDIHFQAPCLFTFFKLGIRIFWFPLYLAILIVINCLRGRPILKELRNTISHCKSILGNEGFYVGNICKKVIPSALTMLGHQLAYTYSLAYLTTSIASAMLALTVTIAYLISWIILRNKPIIIKCFFVLVSLGGIGLIAAASFTSQYPANALAGMITAVVSVLSLCLHQLVFRRSFPGADLEQVAFILELMFLFITIIFFPIPIILKIASVEVYHIQDMPYAVMLAAWILSAFNSTAYGYGLILSSSTFMSIGELLNLALNSGIDVYIRELPMQATQIAGSVLVAFAFIFLIMPDHLLTLNLGHLFSRFNPFQHSRLAPSKSIIPSTSSTGELVITSGVGKESGGRFVDNEQFDSVSDPTHLIANTDDRLTLSRFLNNVGHARRRNTTCN